MLRKGHFVTYTGQLSTHQKGTRIRLESAVDLSYASFDEDLGVIEVICKFITWLRRYAVMYVTW